MSSEVFSTGHVYSISGIRVGFFLLRPFDIQRSTGIVTRRLFFTYLVFVCICPFNVEGAAARIVESFDAIVPTWIWGRCVAVAHRATDCLRQENYDGFSLISVQSFIAEPINRCVCA